MIFQARKDNYFRKKLLRQMKANQVWCVICVYTFHVVVNDDLFVKLLSRVPGITFITAFPEIKTINI